MNKIIPMGEKLNPIWNQIILNQIKSEDVGNLINEMKYKQEISFAEIDIFIDNAKKFGFQEICTKVLSHCGWISLEEHHYNHAIKYFEDTISTAEEMGVTKEVISSYSGMMCSYFLLGMYDESFKMGSKGLQLAEESNNEELLVQALGNIAINYFELNYLEDAKKSIEAVRKLSEPRLETSRIALNQIEARLNLALGKIEEANIFINKAYECANRLNYHVLVADVLRIRGVINYKLGDYDKCCEDFNRAITISRQHQYSEKLALTYCEWGNVESELGHDDEAEGYLLKAYSFIDETTEPLLYTKICKAMVQFYKKVKSFEKALMYYEINSKYEHKMELKRSEAWSQRLLKEKIMGEVRVFKTLYDELQMISAIGQSFTRKLKYETIVNKVKEELSKLMSTPILMITQRNEERQCFEYVAATETEERLVLGTIDFDDEHSLGYYCVKKKQNLIIYDLDEENERYQLKKVQINENKRSIRSLICCPLMIQDEVIGYISVQSYECETYKESDLTKLQLLASYIAIAVENAKLYDKTKYLASHDGLTGLYNRMKVLQKVEPIFNQKDSSQCLSVIMFDIDYFKKINDNYGHQIGDKVLRSVSQIIQSQKNDNLIAGRYGGEEFILFLLDQTEQEAFDFAEKIRKEIDELTIEEKYHVTISLGVYEYDLDVDGLEKGISCADQALYQSKMNGRNLTTRYMKS